MKETQIQSQIIDYLQLLTNQGELFFQRVNNTPIYDPAVKTWRVLPKGTKKGFPDILILKDGKCIGLEIKTNIGKQSKGQKEIEKEFKKHGADYFVVRSLDEVIEIIGGRI